MIVIGVDAHKATHTAAAVNGLTAELLGDVTVKARQHGHAQLLAWASGLDEQRVWAIEDCRILSSGLERALLEAGEHVLRVPPKLMANQRKSERTFSKSDPIDALAIARAAIREPNLPSAVLPGIEHEIGLLVDHRDDLVKESTGYQRRLRWHLHQLDPEYEIPAQGFTNPSNVDKVGRRLQRMEQVTQVRICRDLVRRIRELNKYANELRKEIGRLVRQTHPELLAIPGIGILCAGSIIAEVDGIGRFRTEAQLASYAGVAPLDASSGRQQRHRLNRTGNRKLNRALHIVAVTQIRVYPPATEYYERRKTEGKSNREALRTLKRHLARRVFNTLQIQTA
ncbi:IS110 family transposase [Conexibacter sp. W3-3-2]|uniref:IS110 family transposase n=1 Tax=Conexibacter sp. W3-3-2 TaxID=2675227 RepID=UPI0012B721BF|nr:IS110 family transposase [Conexibacter sp. W3-3-2]MTD43646.1 IS110 family transposase [Conexibacter sp. W3-3-2]